MDNQDKTTFSLDDEEIVEEEVIDRDEEYDDEEYDDEGYDDEYDDEEYDDEGYDDEGYDDEGYNDDYYDDRLNKVLDEIAELKRGMAPANIMPQPPIMPPQYIYQPTAPPAGSEVVMYNEISRLRDELAKNQSNLETQKELTRLKEDMARDQRITEMQHNAEIQRLQSKIEDLLKNAESPQDELPAGQGTSHVEGGNNKSSVDFDKLLSVSESVLLATRDSDARLQNEIGQLKKRLEDLPSLKELNGAVSAVRKAANNASGVNPDLLAKLSNDIAALRAVLEEKGGVVPAQQPVASAAAANESAASTDTSELLRQLYDIKNVLGNSSAAAVKRTQVMYDLVCEYKKLNFDVHSQSTPFKDKLAELDEYTKKLADCSEPDAIDLIDPVNSLVTELASLQLTRDVFTDVVAYANESGTTNVSKAVRDSAERYFNIFDKISSAKVDEYADYLPDLVDAINALESNKNETKNAELVTQITNALVGEDRDDEAIKDMLAELAVLEVADVLAMPMLDKPKAYKPARSIGDESIFGKLDEIKAAVLEAAAAPAADSAPTEAKPEEAYQAQSEQPEKTEEEQDLDYGAVAEILAAVDELKAALGANENADISQVLEEVRNNYVELANKLVQIFEAIQTPPMVTSDGDEVRYIPTMTEEEKHHAIDDLIYIREKMDEQGELVTRLDEIQNAILGIGGNSDVPASLTDSINALLGDINTQFDKLYEDLSNALIESESNIIARFSEFGNPAESVENARLDIIADNQTTRDAVMSLSDAVLADTQAIRESLLAASDSSLTATVNDAIEQLRADVAALTAQTAQNTDAATLDRQKLLDDVTFLREQAELAIAESEQAAGEDVDRHAEQEEAVNAYLDDISSRVALLATVPDDVATVRDAVISVSDNVNAVLDNVTLLGDTVQPIAEDVAATRDTANAVLEALAPISEQLTSILERFDAAAEEQPLYEEQEVVQENVAEEALSGQELAELKESVNSILDTLTLLPQAEDVVAARDNTYSIIETLTAMPHAEDVNVTRDNVASVLAAVTSLSENMEAVLASTNASAQVADGLTAMTETVNTTAEDVNYIRTKLDEQQAGENLSQIMQDIGTVLDKIEEFSLAAANNKQEIIDTVNGIREEVHISTLDETMTAAGIDDETRDVLIGEIADMRERLAGIESATQSMSELNTTTLDGINGQLADLQALLEERLSGEAVEQTESGENASDALKVVLDEIATLKEKLDVQTEFDTVEEILSLREDIKASRIVDQDEVSGELEAIKNELAAISSGNILDEIRALREDLVNMPSGEGAAEPTGGELNLVLNEIVSLRDEVFSFKDEVLGGGVAAEPQGEQSEPQSGDDVNAILDELSALRIDQSALTDNIDELKDLISRRTSLGVAETDGEEQQVAPSAGELNVVLDEIINLKNDIERIEASLGDDNLDALRTEISELKAAVGEMSPAGDYATELDTLRAEVQALREENEQLRMAGTSDISAQLAEIKEAMQGMALSGAPAATADDTMYAALIEEIRGLKEAFAANAEPAQQSFDLGDELLEIRDEIAQLRSLTTVTAESGGAAEVAAMRDELAELKNMLSQSDSLYAVAEDVTAIKADVQSLKDEPDLGVMSEILALRDEFQALREQIEEVKRVAGQTNKAADDSLMNEVQSLRDQLFAISMANVNDPASGESNYESYNNIILDEIASLRDQVNAVSNGADQEAMAEEFASLREAIDRRDAAYDELAELVGSMNNAAENSKILDEIASLRNEVANQRDADMSTLNFMSEMAHLIERQNQYLTKNAGTDIADKIESLKAELASSDAIAQEVAKLRKIMEQAGSSSDNDTILNELAELREELSAAKPSRENEIILDAIARLRNEVTMLAERENAPAINTADTDLSDSLSDLKVQLNEIAGIVEPQEKAKPAAKKPAAKKPAAKGGKKSGTQAKKKSGTASGAKRGRKPNTANNASATAQQAVTEQPVADIDAIIEEQYNQLSGGDDMSLNVAAPTTSDAMEVAGKLAKQVANKLIMEQLVEQLGDGGVSEERVDEILRDILPQEFTTIAETESSDKIRRLANQLVLDKLRSRLNGGTNDEE